jgi:CheY-like chemotaxis protein
MPVAGKKPRGASGGGRILVAEDNEINQAVLESQLELLGYSAVVVRDGKECLEAWKTGQFDAVLTDCQMPVMDGFELTQHLRDVEAEERRPHTPVIAVTANALEGEADRCLAAGMDDYLSKPVTIAALEKVLERHVSLGTSLKNAPLRDGLPPAAGSASG